MYPTHRKHSFPPYFLSLGSCSCQNPYRSLSWDQNLYKDMFLMGVSWKQRWLFSRIIFSYLKIVCFSWYPIAMGWPDTREDQVYVLLIYHLPCSDVSSTVFWCIIYHVLMYHLPCSDVPSTMCWCTIYHVLMYHLPCSDVPSTMCRCSIFHVLMYHLPCSDASSTVLLDLIWPER